MHLELGQSTVDLFHVFCGQYKFGGFDVLLKVLDLARSGDRDDERLLGQEPCERQLRCCCVLPFRNLRDVIDKGLFAAMLAGWKRSNPERRSDFGSNLVCGSRFWVR
jgi:hypothetical protein